MTTFELIKVADTLKDVVEQPKAEPRTIAHGIARFLSGLIREHGIPRLNVDANNPFARSGDKLPPA